MQRPASSDTLLALCRLRSDEHATTIESMYETIDTIGLDTLSEYEKDVATEAILIKIEASIDDFVTPREVSQSIIKLRNNSDADDTFTSLLRAARTRFPEMLTERRLTESHSRLVSDGCLDEMD